MKKRLTLFLGLILGLSACGGGTPAKKDFEGITFTSSTITYDGEAHTIVANNVPEFATATYYDNGPFTDVGTYPMSVKVTADGYNDYTANATLTINGQDITGITFENESLTYDGLYHTINIEGELPSGCNVSYTNHGPFINAGTYQMTATISGKGYNTKTFTATLSILKKDFSGIEFKSKTFEYDGNPHSITITGALPEGATVTYKSNKEGITNTATNVGTYKVTASIRCANYEDLDLSANLVISTSDTEKFICKSGDGLFFQNAIDNDELYVYDFQNSKLKYIGGVTLDIKANGAGSIICESKAVYGTAIKTATLSSGSVSTDSITCLYGARYIQTDGNYYYFVKNGFTDEKSGIYKLDVTDEENPITTCLSVGKASYLNLVNGYLYFADGSNDNKFSYILTSGSEQTRTVVRDHSINNLYYVGNNTFFYTVDNVLGDYLAKDITSNGVSSGFTKINSDAAINMCVAGDYVYYINVDKISTAIYGDGIYKAPVSGGTSIKVITPSEYGVSSLTSDGTYLYYYDCENYQLIKCDLSGNNKVNLLDGFKKEETAPLSTGSQITEHNGKIYYLDLYDNKTLHVFNPQTSYNQRLTANKVANFSFVGDKLYANQVTYVANNDLYMVDISTGGEFVKISTDDVEDIVGNDTNIFFIKNGALTDEIHKANHDGTEDTTIYDGDVSNLRLVDNNLYFIDDNNLYSLDTSDTAYPTTEIQPGGSSVHTDYFDTDGTNLYIRRMYGFAYNNKSLIRCDLTGNNYVEMISSDTDPIRISCVGDQVYYYTETGLTTKATNGIYKINKTAGEGSTGTAVFTTGGTYYPLNFVVYNDYLYFISFRLNLGDSHLYKVALTGGTPIKIA